MADHRSSDFDRYGKVRYDWVRLLGLLGIRLSARLTLPDFNEQGRTKRSHLYPPRVASFFCSTFTFDRNDT